MTAILAANAANGTVLLGGSTIANLVVLDGQVCFDLLTPTGQIAAKVSGKASDTLVSLPL
jgi:hypothetical protein